jgi:hypothetical protein
MKRIAIVIAIFTYQNLIAQDSTRIFIEAGNRFSDVVTPQMLYRYNEFKPGRILFRDGVIMESKLNYNLFNGEIVFISPGHDTLAIGKEQMLNIKRVGIDTDTYVYNKKYLQVLLENNSGTLARKQQYFIVSREKIGGYNLGSPTSSIDSYTSFADRQNNRYDLVVRENITFQLKTEYFVGDSYNLFLPLNNKNLEKIFFKKKNELRSYLQDHPVDLKNEKQLTSLFLHLTDPQ